jgi:hypothetical protein
MVPGSAQERQPPSQATLQHTPSAQKPEAHSSAAPQCEPLGFFPQLALTHWWSPTQSLFCAHLSKQAPVASLQPYGAQMNPGAGRQRPPPSQTSAPTTAPASQCPLPHEVPAVYLRQAPAPSHVPSCPQVIGSEAAHVCVSRGFVPAGTNVQVPMAVGAEHVLHVSAQAVLQQTPSTQKLLVHSLLQPQAWPSSFWARPSTGQ